MAPRTLPGIGLQGYETAGTSGWNSWVDPNWRIISALIQARVKSVVALLPASPTNGDIHVIVVGDNANSIALRDNGAWVYLTPQVGYRVYDEETTLTWVFSGSAWAPEHADLTATTTAAAMVLRKKGSGAGANAPVALGGALGHYQFQGWTGAAWRVGAQILAQAQELWSGTVSGTQMVFQLVANGTTALVDKMRLSATELWVDAKLTGSAAQTLGALWCAAGGSANAVSLTYGGLSLVTGLRIRFRASSSNTGATTINLDGTGAIACRTITGVALPSGYIRSDADTIATYDGTYWVLDRAVERGANGNGSWLRHADGKQECWHTGFAATVETADGSVYQSAAEAAWTFPVSFISIDTTVVTASARNVARWAHGRPTTTSAAAIRQYSGQTSAVSVDVNAHASGFWY